MSLEYFFIKLTFAIPKGLEIFNRNFGSLLGQIFDVAVLENLQH